MPARGSDPRLSNRERADRRALVRATRGMLTVRTPGGRRRKKAILNAELPRLRELVRSVAMDLHRSAH